VANALASCSVNASEANGGAGGATIAEVCDLMLDQCGAAEHGFTRSECQELADKVSINCVNCILDSGCDYEEQCHDLSNNCELR